MTRPICSSSRDPSGNDESEPALDLRPNDHEIRSASYGGFDEGGDGELGRDCPQGRNGPQVERRDDVGSRARWSSRFGPIRWHAVLGSMVALAVAGTAGTTLAVFTTNGTALAMAIAGTEAKPGIASPGTSDVAIAHNDARSARSAEPSGVTHSMAGPAVAGQVVATVTPPGGPTAAPPVVTVTPVGDPPTPPVATVTPVGAPPIFAVTVTPDPGGGTRTGPGPGTGTATSTPPPSSTPLTTATMEPSPSPSPDLTATAPATAGTTISWAYLPVTMKNAEIGGP